MAYVGIDLGTTYSAISILNGDGHPITIPNAEGDRTTPSVVLFDTDTDIVVGRDAKAAALTEAYRVAVHPKRFMGRKFYPDKIIGNDYSPVALSSLILSKLKKDATNQIGDIDGAVITVPAYFDDIRRQATQMAAELAHLDLLGIINEPTAAALAFIYAEIRKSVDTGQAALDRLTQGPERIVLVYDLGGGTFDVTMIMIRGLNIEVIGTDGDVQLGGRDWDQRLVDSFAAEFQEQYFIDPRNDPESLQTMLQTAEEVKKTLTSRTQARYVINHQGHRLSGKITRDTFEELTVDLLYRTENRVNLVCEKARISWDQVDDVIVVGGSTRMPQVTDMLLRITGKQPYTGLSPDEAVAHGAAIYASMSLLKNSSQADPTPEYDEDIQTTTTIKHRLKARTQLVRFIGNRLSSFLESIKATDVNPHTLGLVTYSKDNRKGVSQMIQKNTPLPVAVEKTFGTQTKGQDRISIQIVEGESANAEMCISIGTCTISALPKGLPKGSPVRITFDYDINGCIHCKAIHIATGIWAETIIQRNGGVDKELMQMDQELLRKLTIT